VVRLYLHSFFHDRCRAVELVCPTDIVKVVVAVHPAVKVTLMDSAVQVQSDKM
jgi:hypothetical protein